MNNIGREMTFWSLINEVSIRIPIIQRDYVQGRRKDQVVDARRNLLNDMRMALESEGSLDLNFIYGKEQTQNSEKVFIPLDGQQRLTTLFLLHWFSFAKENDFVKATILHRFSYETRISSRKFLEQLVKNTEKLASAVIDRDQRLSEYIRNEAWFWVDWSYDPTIDSILIMLDEIKEMFIDIIDLSNKLTGGSFISFRFLNMCDLGMEDSLYIKLNARGRLLTDFENFKAELVKYVKQVRVDGTLNPTIADAFASEMDGKWTDLFWQWTSGNKENFDKIYMNCFHWILWNRWAEKQKRIEKSNYSITSAMNRTAYYRLNSYKDNGVIDGKALEDMYYTLTYYSPLVISGGMLPASNINGIEWLKKCSLASGTAITYEDRVMLSAVTTFISINKGMIDEDAFAIWLRVLKNLARNTRLDGLDDYMRAVQSIVALSDHCLDLLSYLASPNCSISGFLNEQIEEERLKAKLILSGDNWANAIYEAEKHPYFDGQIAFLLSFSGLDLQTFDSLTSGELDKCLKLFTTYKNKAYALFNEKGLTVNPDLFSRAVLTKGDYLLSYKRCKSFLIGNHRDISWKTLLRNSNAGKRLFLKELMDELDETDLSRKSIGEQLKAIVDKSTVNDWRQYFISMENLLKDCGYYRLIYAPPEGRILLVSCQTTAGYNKEYYTYVLHSMLAAQGKQSHYSPDRGQYGEMLIDMLNGKDIKVKYKKDGNNARWELEIDYNGIIHCVDTTEDALAYLLTLT